MSKLKEALLKLGLDENTVADLEKQDGTISVDDAVKTAKSHVYGLAKNDPEFLEPIRKDNTGRIHAGLRKKLKEFFGVDEVEGKTTEDLLQMAAEMTRQQIADAKASGDSKDVVKKLQDELVAANTALKNLQEIELPKAKLEAENQIEAFKFDMSLTSKIGNKQLLVPPSVAALVVKEKLAERGLVAKLENGTFTVLTKEGTKPFNADKTKMLEADEILDGLLDGLIKHQPTPPAPPIIQTPKDEKRTRPVHPNAQQAAENANKK